MYTQLAHSCRSFFFFIRLILQCNRECSQQLFIFFRSNQIWWPKSAYIKTMYTVINTYIVPFVIWFVEINSQSGMFHLASLKASAMNVYVFLSMCVCMSACVCCGKLRCSNAEVIIIFICCFYFALMIAKSLVWSRLTSRYFFFTPKYEKKKNEKN